MRVAHINVYKFEELSYAAKEKAKRDFLETDIRKIDFQYTLDEFYEIMFPNSELHYQFDLSYGQGSGFNTYGNLNIKDLSKIRCMVPCIGKDMYKPICEDITDEEWGLIKSCFNEYDTNINLPQNRRYCYSLARQISLEDYFLQLSPSDKKKYEELLQKFQNVLRDFLENLNKYWERYGYDFLYNISDEVFSEFCEANDWEFHDTGVIWSLD